MITSSLTSIQSACASLSFEDAGSIALVVARQNSKSSGDHDELGLISELLSAATINVTPAAEQGKSWTPADGRLHWVLAAAINSLLKHSFDAQTTEKLIENIMTVAYVPLLASNAGLDASQSQQVLEAAVATIIHAGAWPYLLEFLSSRFPTAAEGSRVLLLEPGMVRFSSRLIDAAPTTTENGENGNEENRAAAAAVLSYAADVIFPIALSTLTSSSTKKPTPTLATIGQSLLPAALSAAKKVGKLSSCLTLLWSTCIRLGQSDTPSECRNGLSLLVQFCQPLLQHANISQDPALWGLLLRALRSDQALNRKRALHVLENAIAQLQEEEESKEIGAKSENIAAWGTFIRLFITVDDTSMHLFKEAWPEVDRLHAPAVPAAHVDAPPISEVNDFNEKSLALPLPWMLLLWERALQHRHLTAQKIAAVSFLQRIWPEDVLAQIPPSFCSTVLLPVLGQNVMQRGEYAEEIGALVPGFFQKWSAALPRKERLELLKSMLTLLAGREKQQAMMQLTAKALVAATKGSSSSIFEAEQQAELVRGAAAAAAAQPGFGANAIALKIYAALVTALSSCVVIGSVEMIGLVTSFLAAIPVPLLQPGGLLCAQLVAWFSLESHAAFLPNELEILVNMHLESLKIEEKECSSTAMGSSGEKKKRGGPSQKEIAYGALVLAEAVAAGSDGSGREQAEECLNTVFASWKAEFYTEREEKGGKSSTVSTAALPLLAALLAASKELPTKETAATNSCLKIWLSSILSDICDALVSAVDETHSVWLLSMAQRASLEKLSTAIEAECAEKNISKDEAFNNDDVLPKEFVSRRNAACDALACVAGAPALLLSENSQHREKAEKYAACAARFVKTCSTGYATLIEDFSIDSVDMRVRLEAAIAILRPLVACSKSMTWPLLNTKSAGAGAGDVSSADSSNTTTNIGANADDIIALVTNLLDALEAARSFVPAARKKEKTRASNKKKKNSWKLEPLTLHSWHSALSWRSLEAFVANNAEKSPIFPLELQGRIFATAVLGLSTSPEGSNAIIPYIRCLRTMIPDLVQHYEIMVTAVVAAAAKAAADEKLKNNASEGKEKQQYQELLHRLLAAGNTATLNDVVAWMGNALLFSLSIHVRKRTGMTAAVLSCCLHPCFFKPGQEALHRKESVQKAVENGAGGVEAAVGAVRSIVQGFLTASTKHSRTFVLFSTQFSALLAAFPVVGSAYCDVVAEMLQMGFDDEHHLQSLDDAILDEPTVAELTSLLEPLDSELAKAHMASFAAPRVGSLCLLHSWVHQGLAAEEKKNEKQHKENNDEALVGLAAARELWNILFDLAITDPELTTGRYLHKGPTHRKKLRVWQALTVLCPAVPSSAAADTLAHVLDALDIPNAATVKQFQEIAALKMIQNQPDLLESRLLPRIGEYTEQRNEAMPCLISIAAVATFFAAKKQENDTILEENKKKELIKRVVSVTLPWTATFVHGSRTFAQLVLWRMAEVYPWLPAEDALFAEFYKFFSTNVDLKRLRGAMGVDFGLDNFDFERATSPKGVLCEEAGLLGTSNTGGPLEGVPLPLMDCLSSYLAQERLALRGEIDAKMADYALQDELRRNSVKISTENGDKDAPETEQEETAAGANGATATLGDATAAAAATVGAGGGGDFYQRKITPSDKEAVVTDPWGAALGLAALSSKSTTSTGEKKKSGAVVVDDFEAGTLRTAIDEAISTAQNEARQELIVVASLIDKLPNLAGLARTCEVFRASRLVLADASITKNPTFASISVSAEHWVPIEQVSPVVLGTWLRKKATEGYTLVGLEQTAESTPLQDYKFPKKTVLLLGAELEGVPADLLELLDATVEIPQLGVVRSLNVHVSAAIGIYEFTRQSLAAAAGAAELNLAE